MTRSSAILEVLRSAFVATESLDPSEQDIVYRAVLDTVRARRPESVGCLGLWQTLYARIMRMRLVEGVRLVEAIRADLDRDWPHRVAGS